MAMMSHISSKLPMALFLSSLFLNVALGEIICENLPSELCAFSVASSGKRCLLETYKFQGGGMEYQCRTSEIIVERIAGHMESDHCVKICGVDRNSAGISSDALLEPQFTAKLCSPKCYTRCPNIIDLYYNLAAGEGVFLPDLCEAQSTNTHRAMTELLSSGSAPSSAASPLSYQSLASTSISTDPSSPAPSPV
ncbi:hypothetical protein SAY86_012795 [Trapa natans]|uniref:PAR1 protein n=1 Tax=Trapa natans TaxID=22666 RepID=A0AAN7LXB3_TRANT|nr:hypothetical protein SAY86_012795 [Trapa natans]